MEASAVPLPSTATKKATPIAPAPKIDFCSFLYHGQIAFGKLPTPIQAEMLRQQGFTVFVNLLKDAGKGDAPYKAETIVPFPIMEDSVPKQSVEDLIEKLREYLKEGKKIYIHCKNGRGRTGMIVACLIGIHLDLAADPAIDTVNRAHRKGHGRSKKWQKVEIPSHRNQMKFVEEFLDDEQSSYCDDTSPDLTPRK